MILFLVFLIVVLGGGLFILSERMGSGTAVSTSNLQPETVSEPVVVKENATENENVLVPAGWKLYSNADLKFSIMYPESAYSPNGACEERSEGSRFSYRPKMAKVPVGVYEDEDGIFITFTYSYELGDEESIDNVSYFGSCSKKATTLEQLKLESMRRTWHIITKQVASKTALETFVKQRFGSGCSIDTMTATVTNSKVYDVKIKGDGLDLGETKCPINYMFVLKYVPDIGMAYTYDLGQAYTFPKTADGSQNYDEEMSESFHPIF